MEQKCKLSDDGQACQLEQSCEWRLSENGIVMNKEFVVGDSKCKGI